MESAPGPEVVIDGVPYLYFGGTSYLGLAARAEVIEAGCEAMRCYGVHSATTRARFGTNPPVLEAEQNAARFFGKEEAFYYGSGYVGNHILTAALVSQVEAVLVDEAAHYCVLDAARAAGKPVETFRTRDPADLQRVVSAHRRVLVMADAVSPSTGQVAPVADYLGVLSRCDRAVLLLDDAHGFGVLGDSGRGLLEEFNLWSHSNGGASAHGIELAVCGTLAKALGGFGGIVPGTREFVARARSSSHYFDGASAPASAIAGATAKALEIVMREPELRQQLRQNSGHLRNGLRALGLEISDDPTAHFGVTVGDASNMQRLHDALKARGIMAPYVGQYTGIPKEGLLRIAVFADHTTGQLDHLINEFSAIL